MNFNVGYVNQNKQTRQHGIGKFAGYADLLPKRQAGIVGNADVDAASAILNREALIKRA
jgi:hypothetical protein